MSCALLFTQNPERKNPSEFQFQEKAANHLRLKCLVKLPQPPRPRAPSVPRRPWPSASSRSQETSSLSSYSISSLSSSCRSSSSSFSHSSSSPASPTHTAVYNPSPLIGARQLPPAPEATGNLLGSLPTPEETRGRFLRQT